MRLRFRVPISIQQPSATWADEDLVRECLHGNEEAWSALIDKYKQLVYSIPFKYHAPPQDAADIFQAVWIELYGQLHRLRKPGAVRSWLVQVAAHQCFHWKRQRQAQEARHETGSNLEAVPAELAPQAIEELEREQILREAIDSLPLRCREMIRLLFFEDPPVPYSEVARRLGLAVGSIGFIRGRCLKRLQRALQDRGF